jgi:hypothetical protein
MDMCCLFFIPFYIVGFGKCSWSDGRTYVGMWHMGQAHGQGKEMNPNGSIRHEGIWSYDVPVKTKKSSM